MHQSCLISLWSTVCVEVLRPSQPMGSCQALSVYLTTLLLGRLSPLSGYPVLCTFFHQKLTTAFPESAEGREWKYFVINLHERMFFVCLYSIGYLTRTRRILMTESSLVQKIANLADDNIKYFSYFSQKLGLTYHANCLLKNHNFVVC